MKTIQLKLLNGTHTLVITLDINGNFVQSDLRSFGAVDTDAPEAFDFAMDAFESIVLAHACAGINIEDPNYIKGLEVAIESAANNLL